MSTHFGWSAAVAALRVYNFLNTDADMINPNGICQPRKTLCKCRVVWKIRRIDPLPHHPTGGADQFGMFAIDVAAAPTRLVDIPGIIDWRSASTLADLAVAPCPIFLAGDIGGEP